MSNTAIDPGGPRIWSSARCTFWTDRWETLGRTPGGIPACPGCGMVGYLTTETEWWSSARAFEREGNDGYTAWLRQIKGQCLPGLTGLEAWQTHQALTARLDNLERRAKRARARAAGPWWRRLLPRRSR